MSKKSYIYEKFVINESSHTCKVTTDIALPLALFSPFSIPKPGLSKLKITQKQLITINMVIIMMIIQVTNIVKLVNYKCDNLTTTLTRNKNINHGWKHCIGSSE